MECDLQKRHELIADYVTGELPEDEARIFEEHYFQCETCFAELQIAQAATDIVERDGPAVLTVRQSPWRTTAGTFWRRFSSPAATRRRAIATIAVTGILLALVVLTGRSNKTGSTGLTGPNFEPVPYFEEWISESTRSANEALDTVISPALGEKFTDHDITFRWQMRENVPVSLKVLTNFEEEVFTAKPDAAQFPLYVVHLDRSALGKPGLYYWRIEDENEVLFLGKFYLLNE